MPVPTYTRTWDETTPTDLEVKTGIPAAVKNSKVDVRERVAVWGGRYSNLIIQPNASSPNSQIDIDADVIGMEEYIAENVDLTVNIAASGANGLDTGSEAASKLYAVWVIYNPSTSTAAGLFSLSFTAPTMPSGYTKKKLISMVRNDGSGNFISFLQQGSNYIYRSSASGDLSVLSGGQATTSTAVSLTSVVSTSITKMVYLLVTCYTLSSNTSYLYVSSQAITGSEVTDAYAAGGGILERLYKTLGIDGAGNVYYKVSSANGYAGIVVMGATLNI